MEFQQYRQQYQPKLPKLLQNTHQIVQEAADALDDIKKQFPILSQNSKAIRFTEELAAKQENKPLRIGCVLSGGQAAGGHNVIVGLYEQIKRVHQSSQLFGFLDGPKGIFTGNYKELKDDTIQYFKNRGGFDMIKSGRDKIETEEQKEKSLQFCQQLDLDGLVVIGGDDSNTNACVLAEFFKSKNVKTSVIGCPKTIDGDLKNTHVEVSFGFDTACKVYSELIGNIMLDTLSTKKYYHFIRLMGRSASNIALECALINQPNAVLIGEEITQKNKSLDQIVSELTDLIIKRREKGKTYGVILIPEGTIEFIPEIKLLIDELNHALAGNSEVNVKDVLSQKNYELLQYLPKDIQNQLLLDRDPHGNVQVAQIETEKLFISCIEQKIAGKFDFKSQTHYFGYEGRCAYPTNFDCDYCYGLGTNAAVLIQNGFSGLMSCLQQLHKPVADWVPCGYPLISMMNTEIRHGKPKPVIKKFLVDLEGELFKYYKQNEQKWAEEDHYINQGPIQFENEDSNQIPHLIKLQPQTDSCNKFIRQRQAEKQEISEVLEKNSWEIHKAQNLSLPITVDNYAKQLYPFLHHESSQLVEIKKCFQQATVKSQKVGVCFNGRQSPGGHNVIAGLLSYAIQNKGQLYGFQNGTEGLFANKHLQITQETFKEYNNTGGYQLIGRSADKLRTQQELEATLKTCQALALDGLVLIGASHTCSDALLLTNYFLEKQCKTKVIVVPASVDNNVAHHMLEQSVGFDTASKLYSQLIGNVMIDASSCIKYWYFIRVMGRDPSHLVLECALQTKPNVCLISEEIQNNGWTLEDVVNYIADIVVQRAQKDKNFGTVLVPEGLLGHLPQFKLLISELNSLFKGKTAQEVEQLQQKILQDGEYLKTIISPWAAARFANLPNFTQKQLLFEREVHGTIQLSQISTEKLLAHLVKEELANRKQKGEYKKSFSTITHFFGYQGRCATPSKLDCNLAFAYGFIAQVLIQNNFTGYCTTVRGISGALSEWNFAGIPLINMCQLSSKSQYGENKAIVKSAEVNLKSKAFETFKQQEAENILNDYYMNPGPTQFFGQMANEKNKTLEYNNQNYIKLLKDVEDLNEKITQICKYGTHEEVLDIAIQNLTSLTKTLEIVAKNYQ